MNNNEKKYLIRFDEAQWALYQGLVSQSAVLLDVLTAENDASAHEAALLGQWFSLMKNPALYVMY